MANHDEAQKVIALLSSSLFWWWYTISSNLRDLNPSDINNFPLPSGWEKCDELIALGEQYSADLCANSRMLQRVQQKTGTTLIQSFKIQKSKSLLDQIDTILSRLYDLSKEQLDFIINYDISYRMSEEDNEADIDS